MVKHSKSKLTDNRIAYKPFAFPEFYEFWHRHEQEHWIANEVNLHRDIVDWNTKLTEGEKNFLTQVLRFFTQGDIDVAGSYVSNYLPHFPITEARMMLLGFAAREAVHIDGYSHLITTLGLPDAIYSEFMEYEEMRAKHQFLMEVNEKEHTETQIAHNIAVFSGLTEGVQLFSSFAMLLNFARNNVLPGLGQIIIYSIVDENLHCEGMTALFKAYVKEHPGLVNDEFKKGIYDAARKMIELEDKFIDLAFASAGGVMRRLTADEVKKYVRYLADRRLIGLGLKGIFGVKKNPLSFMEEMTTSAGHTSFLEIKATEYSKGNFSGSWGEVWASNREA